MAPFRILVLAHDLSDAAVQKRVLMLREGGAEVTVAGFRRTDGAISTVSGNPAVDFGQTYNAGFMQRIWSVLREVALLGRRRSLFANADLILARNLEMLAIAVRGRSLCKPAPVIVYESLDIHRLLLRRDFIGQGLRALEGWLGTRASAVITSSPAFISNYFNTLSRLRLPIRLVENKVLAGGSGIPKNSDLAPRVLGLPLTIGWFGVIRCTKSLYILADLVEKSAGMIEVIIRGRPAHDQFVDFHKTVSEMPGVKFLGPYKNPDDLAEMYRGVHFTWAIDMFEEGLNSSWLLPNRLYEGGAFGSVPLAMDSVETGHFLQRLGIGVTLPEPLGQSLADFFGGLTPERYRALEEAALKVPPATWIDESGDCKDLVDYFRSLSGGLHG